MVWQQEDGFSYSDFFVRQKIILFCFALLFFILSIRLFYLQIIRGSSYEEISEQQRIYNTKEVAPRGLIYASDGSMIVENAFTYSLLFYPFDQAGMPTDETIVKLNKILKKDIKPYLEEGLKTGKIVKLADKLTTDEMFKVQENKMGLNGVTLLIEPVRVYNFPEENSHITGYLGEINKEELKALSGDGYVMGDYIGKGGVEQVYDTYLRGINGGRQLEVNAKGAQTQIFNYTQPVTGNSLYLTIDPKLQKLAYESLVNSASGRGSVVIIDVRTGAVKALVSAPGYNGNKINSEDFNVYLKDKNLPLYNRATQALYAPGSIFKIVVFAAAVESGFDINETVFCSGHFDFGDRRYACWYKPGHGRVNMMEAMAQSCNVYFYNLALKLGVDKIDEFSWRFHLSEQTGIDLPNEKKGFVPTPTWKKAKDKIPWLQGDTINFGIGQGALWVTPLQMAAMISAVANKGISYRPYIVSKAVSPNGNEIYTHSVRENEPVNLSSGTWDILHKALIETVEKGTARRAYFPNIKVAGKTGTAQNPQGDDHAWFVSFAPADNPEIAIAIIVENAGGGSANAVPIGRKIYEAYFSEGEYENSK
ncbi:MAG: penicillin-binding protein 2 [Elusimicrobiota bacterium]|jgi:penicillin-binding protein 2|nr:penicillin-binding protein 2 [Elusimicrobiota bacterium]